MIIWINGTFGAGKTTTAYELVKRLEKAFVFDPERFGYVLMKNIPPALQKDDFQDFPLWRETNYSLLKQITRDYDGIIIVPMTITNEAYFHEIISRLKNDQIIVKHVTLMASKATIKKRLRSRLEGEDSWAYKQAESRLKQLERSLFREHVDTNGLCIEEVIEKVAQAIGLNLKEDKRNPFRKRTDRLWNKLKEISLFK
ncbi:AAA family ATPase [Niallia circulans]|jgi:cytidylate kinase|uniref:Tunicamycin resistance protein n=2 Tax=Bacillaceae TaxID=186817 RepID=A0A0J1IE26_NIACI|nr:AAA family ATPase [Niallia circulans]KLV24212.1 Tunicamycin resistance protein [Niallia circulans]MCM2981899.1 AAA family ATPase [Niallia circulans]PAE10164.1 tunicamycin resistance protein [Niallia circulans]